VKQIFEEDDLSMSEDERARLAPLRRRKRGSNEGSTTPQKQSKTRKESEAYPSDSDDGKTPKQTVKRQKALPDEAHPDVHTDVKPKKSTRSTSEASTTQKPALRRISKADSKTSAKRKKGSVAKNAVIVLSD
jgi:hypothetical protein